MTEKHIAKIQTYVFYKRDMELENKDIVKDKEAKEERKQKKQKRRRKGGREEGRKERRKGLKRGKKEGLSYGNRRQSLGPAQGGNSNKTALHKAGISKGYTHRVVFSSTVSLANQQ